MSTVTFAGLPVTAYQDDEKNYTTTIGPNSLSNDMDLQKVFSEFERHVKLKGMQRGYIS